MNLFISDYNSASFCLAFLPSEMYFDLRKDIELLYHHRKIWDDLLSLKFEDVGGFFRRGYCPTLVLFERATTDCTDSVAL